MRHRCAITLAVFASVAGLLLVAGCSDDSLKESTPNSSSGTLGTPDYSFGPTTTFMPDCSSMPSPAQLSTLAGIPLADGTVIATGTCEFRGLNDQTRVVTLGLLTDPVDQTNFHDFVASVGTTTPLADANVPAATLGPDSTVFALVNDAVYTVQTNVTDAPVADQIPTSVAILGAWLTP